MPRGSPQASSEGRALRKCKLQWEWEIELIQTEVFARPESIEEIWGKNTEQLESGSMNQALEYKTAGTFI